MSRKFVNFQIVGLSEHKKDSSKHYKKVKISQQAQREARMDKLEEDKNGLKIVVFEKWLV